MNEIHTAAVIHAQAELGDDNHIGPHVVIEPDVVIGNGNQFLAGSVIKSGTRLGDNNVLHEHAVIAGLPQDLSFNASEVTRVVIGDNNTFRESVTVNRASTKEDRVTQIGSDNYFMVGSHIAHDCRLGNDIVVAPYAGFAGHVHIGDKAFISGGVMVHQFVKIGQLAMVGGNAKITQDVLPFFITDGVPAYVKGINIVGLRRAGFSASDIKVLKQAYKALFNTGSLELSRRELKALDHELAVQLHDFVSDSKRSFHRTEK